VTENDDFLGRGKNDGIIRHWTECRRTMEIAGAAGSAITKNTLGTLSCLSDVFKWPERAGNDEKHRKSHEIGVFECTCGR